MIIVHFNPSLKNVKNKAWSAQSKQNTMKKCSSCGRLFVPTMREHCCPSCSQKNKK